MRWAVNLAASKMIFAAICASAAFLSVGRLAIAAPVAVAPYTIATFKGVPPTGATQPDDLAISADGMDLWIGYGNGVDTFGKGGPSNLVEYNTSTGAVLQNLTIPGHLDGLKIDPATGNVWATENEDGNPTLAIVDPTSGKFKIFKVSSNLITGGFDDLAFVPGPKSSTAFIVASSQTDTNTPVVVGARGKMKKDTLSLTAAVPGAGLPDLLYQLKC